MNVVWTTAAAETRFVVLSPLVAAAVMAVGLLAASASAADQAPVRGASQPAGDRVWVGPMPFVTGRSLREDYFPTLTDPEKWPTVLQRAQVLKSYLMVLPADPVPGKTGPELSDAQLRTLAGFARQHHLKVAFEVGGVRAAPDWPSAELGVRTAQSELTHLRRWLRAGGTIDYLTTDHAVMMTIGAPFQDPAHFQQRNLSLAQAVEQQVDYFAIVHREMPEAKLGAIESLGYFEVAGLDGRHYSRTMDVLPKWPFEEYLDTLLAAMKGRGLALDHFHIDFGFGGVQYDGGGGGRLGYGRILAVEAACHARGVKAGLIVNAFHDTSNRSPQSATASREAREHTLQYWRGYRAAGGAADQIIVQTWHPYPDRTGPESDPDTVLGVARSVLAE